MLPTSLKQVFIISSLSIGLFACGGGSGDDKTSTTPPPTPINTAPTIDSFSGEVALNSPLEITFSWQVSDAENDSLSCTLTPGGNLGDIIIDNCLTTTSSTVTYSNAGSFNATLTVADSKNASNNTAITVTLETEDQLPTPTISAEDNQLVIFYNRKDDDYDDWILHLWNNESCDSYANFASDEGTDWATGQAQTGIDPNYGAYWLINLKDNHSDCANFIVHKGDEKDLGGNDQHADLTKERMIWTLSGISDIYTQATLPPSGVTIADTAAHWVSLDTVFWGTNSANIEKIRLYSSAENDLDFNGETGIAGDNYIEFSPQSDNTANAMSMPRYSALSTFVASAPSSDKAKQMLTGKLLAIAYNAQNTVVKATYVQTPRVIDNLYTQGTDDADEALLGLHYSSSDITSKIWAPTAQQVNLQIFDSAKQLLSTIPMTLDNKTGIWASSIPLTNDRLFYRFELNVYHYQNQQFETVFSTDPYSVSLSVNGDYSQFVNLNDNDLKPTGWDSHTIPTVAAPEDAVIYEGHIRDFSIQDQSTSEANRGNYLAFTEESSVPVTHLKNMATAGLTHFQMLPANDIASINEDENSRINLTNTVEQLCTVDSSASVCGVENNAATLLSVFQSYDPSSTQAQTLAQTLRGLDSFNWGYDPKHFSTPDGSYASNPDGVSRIIEMRAMNQALHEMGLRVVLDVVYNHTNSSGLWDNSVLDKVVPGYYHRRDLITGNVFNETCCQDTAPEHKMMDKLMTDSLLIWTEQYKFDGFRFDIMSNNSVESILAARTAVQAIDADNYFYGEGWTRSDQGYTQAQQNNMAGSQVGTFNDRPRDTIRGASLFNAEQNFGAQDTLRLGLAGTLEDYQLKDRNGVIKSGKNFPQSAYAKDPADIINYVSKHDNETLWDQLQYGLPTSMSVDDRVRAQNITATIPLLSQGIPFFQIGGDFIRSKSMDRNTYDAGDWFNRVDFTLNTNNWNVGLPLAQDNENQWTVISELISNSETSVQASHLTFASAVFQEFLAIRNASKLFSLSNAQDVYDRVGFHNTGINQSQGLLVMSIDDGAGLTDLDENVDAIVVVINGANTEQSHTVATATGFELHAIQQNSYDNQVQASNFTETANSGTFTVPALTTAVFIKPQQNIQGTGLSAGITRDAADVAPFGDTELYLRGDMNNWGDSGLSTLDNFTYEGNGVYNLTYLLNAGQHHFKFGAANWNDLELSFDDVITVASNIAITNNGDEMVIMANNTGNFKFTLDASKTTPELTISAISPTIDCTALPDSADPVPFSIAGGGQLYVKGDHSGWGADEAYRLHFKGGNQYQAVAYFDGDMQFKLASDDSNWDTQLWAQALDSTTINRENLAVGVNYTVAYSNAGTDNNQTTLSAGNYSFLLTLNDENPEPGINVGSLIIQQCQP